MGLVESVGYQAKSTRESSLTVSMKVTVAKSTITSPTSDTSKMEKELEKGREFGSQAEKILGTTTTTRSHTSTA
jgi:hypothetical protein